MSGAADPDEGHRATPALLLRVVGACAVLALAVWLLLRDGTEAGSGPTTRAADAPAALERAPLTTPAAAAEPATRPAPEPARVAPPATTPSGGATEPGTARRTATAGATLEVAFPDPGGPGLLRFVAKVVGPLDGAAPVERQLTPGADLRARMSALEPGGHRVWMQALPQARPDGRTVGINLDPVDLREAARTVQLEAGRVTVVEFAPPARPSLRGKVRNRGRPVPGAMVLAVPQGELTSVGGGASRTDGDGRFAILLLRPGLYHLGYGRGDAPLLFEREVRLPEAAQTLELDLEITGATVDVVVLDPGGAPLRGATLRAARIPAGSDEPSRLPRHGPPRHREAEIGVGSGVTDSTGRARLVEVPPGRYELRVTGPGTTDPWFTRVVMLEDGQVLDIGTVRGR